MAAKGYLAESQLVSERQTLARMRHELVKTEGEFRLFRSFQYPKEVQALKNALQTAETARRRRNLRSQK